MESVVHIILNFSELDDVVFGCGSGLVILFKPLIATLILRSNKTSYSRIAIGILAIDGWAVTFGTAKRGLGGRRSPPRPILAVPNVTAHPSTTSVPSCIIRRGCIIAFGV